MRELKDSLQGIGEDDYEREPAVELDEELEEDERPTARPVT
jgi:hypothetical protein